MSGPRADADSLCEQIAAGGLLAPGAPVVVLCSGGRDSTCLLDLAVRICGAGNVHALHLEYGLRAEAQRDEAQCRRTCDALGVALAVEHPRRGGPAPTGNVQAWAREERYAAAARRAAAIDADIAAGHTATDQVETILYRLASSPSRRALLGMAPRQGRLVRPLLAFTRDETAEYCRGRGLSWCEDASNSSDAYARSRIRHRLVPALEQVHPAAQANVLTLAAILAQEAAVLDELVDSVLAGRQEIRLATLRELPAALRRLVVQRLADAAAGEPAAGVGRRADDVAAMSDRGRSALHLPHGICAVAERGTVRFGQTPRAPVDSGG